MLLRVTTADVDRIVAEKDRALRNLQITVAYGRLAEDFVERVDATNLSWCGFGMWASEGVGAAIRHHQTDRTPVLRAMRATLGDRYRTLARIAAQAFAVGNRSVFDHIGRGFAGFHAAIDDGRADAHLDQLERDAGLERVPRGLDVDGTRPLGLADGFRHYLAATTSDNGWKRAQLVAAGNLTLAYVEQLRLQRPVRRAFGSALPRGLVGRPVPRRAAARFFTETVLKVKVGDEEFEPGGELPPTDTGHHWPTDLEVLDPTLFAPFEDVLPHDGRAPDSDDWTELSDRLRYIGALMRSRQQQHDLFTDHPFDEDEVEAIWSGRIPPSLTPKAAGS
jgi:hypothetical protein